MIRYSLLQVLLPGVLLVLAGCQPNSATSEPEYFAAPGTEGMGLPFSGAVKVGQTVYLSGSIGNVPGKMQLVEGGLEAETRQTLENIAQSLEVADTRCTNRRRRAQLVVDQLDALVVAASERRFKRFARRVIEQRLDDARLATVGGGNECFGGVLLVVAVELLEVIIEAQACSFE